MSFSSTGKHRKQTNKSNTGIIIWITLIKTSRPARLIYAECPDLKNPCILKKERKKQQKQNKNQSNAKRSADQS